MRLRRGRRALLLALAPLLLVMPAASSADDIEIGQVVTVNVGCALPVVFFQVKSTGDAYVVPSDGVLTVARMSAGDRDNTRALRVLRPAAKAGDYTVVGAGDDIVIPANTTTTQQVRVPVQAGDLLGVYATGTGPCTGQPADQNDRAAAIYANPEVGTTFTPAFANYGVRVSVQAKLEPDADQDGYGDTTQDQCSTDASTHGPCPTSPPYTSPSPTPGALGTLTLEPLGKPSGKARVGKTLTAPTLTVPSGATASFQWYRTFTKKNGTRVVYKMLNATGPQYKIHKKDSGKRLFVRVFLRGSGYSNIAGQDSQIKRIR